jgi:hypothetical protein
MVPRLTTWSDRRGSPGDDIAKFWNLHPDYNGEGKLVPLLLDLIDPRNAVAAAEKIVKNESRLDFTF